jgi:hypothetical protein
VVVESGARRRLTALGEEMVVDVDHAADDALEVALDRGLVHGARQVSIQTALRDPAQQVQVARDEQHLPRDQVGVDRHDRAACRRCVT